MFRFASAAREGSLREVPLLVAPELLLGPGRQLEPSLHPEEVVEEGRVVEAAEDLVLDLVLGTEDVRVVLGDVLHAQEPVQGASELVPVQGRGLRVAEGQVAVRPELRAEEQHVARAVHRLEGELTFVPVRRREEHVLAVVVVVARRDVRLDVVEERRLHLDVSAQEVLPPAEILEHVPDDHPFRMPERRPGRLFCKVEQVELRPEAAMVALARLLEPLEIRVEILLVVERGAVNARELRVRRIAAPVRAGKTGELERLDRLRRLQMRTAAEIGEVALRVQRDVTLGGVDELELVRLVLRGESRARFVARDFLARPLAAFRELALDLVLDCRQLLLANRLRKVEVVVEAVLDRRTDRDLHSRIQTPDSLGEQVRGRMPEHRERVGVILVAGGQDLDPITVVDR